MRNKFLAVFKFSITRIAAFIAFLYISTLPMSAAELQNMKVSEDALETMIAISFDEDVDYKITELKDPVRLMISFQGKVFTKETESQEFFTGLVKKIRYLTSENKATAETGVYRLNGIIAELKTDSAMTHKKEAYGFSIQLKEKAKKIDKKTTSVESKPAAVLIPEVNNFDVREIGEKTRVIIENAGSLKYRESKLTAPKRLIINFTDKVNTTLDKGLSFSGANLKNLRILTSDNSATEATGLRKLNAVIIETSDLVKIDSFTEDDNLIVDILQDEEMTEEINREQVRILIDSAEQNIKRKMYDLARNNIDKINQIDPDNKKAKSLTDKIDRLAGEQKSEADQLADMIAEEKGKERELSKNEAKELATLLEASKDEQAEEENQFDNLVKAGKKLFRKKRYHEARELWEQAEKIKPGDKGVGKLLEKAHKKIKKTQARDIEISRRKEREEAIASGETDLGEVEELMEKGKEYFSELDYPLAIKTFEEVLTIDPKNTQAMRYLARSRRNQRDYIEKGGDYADIVVKIDGTSTDLGIIDFDDCLAIGLAHHLPTKVAQEEVNLAKIKVSQAKRELFPKVKLKYKQTAGTGNQEDEEDFEGLEYGAEFQQSLFSGGKYRSLYNQARVNLAVSRKNYEKTKQEFLFELNQGYYNLAFAKEKMRHKQELMKRTKELLDIAEKQYSAKALTLSEILDARAQLAEAKFQIQKMQNDLDLAQLGLIQLLSLKYDSSVDTVPIPEPIIFDIDPDELIEVGYKNRRDYQVKKLLVLFNKYGLEIAKKKTGFNVELNGSWGYKDEYYVSESVDVKTEYYVGIKVSKPIGPHMAELNTVNQDKVPQIGQTTASQFSSVEGTLKLWENKDQTSISEANIKYHKALKDLEDSKRELIHDVMSSIFSVREAEAKMKNQKSNVSLATEELRSTRAKQKVEQSTIVQVMRAEAKLWNAKTELVSAQADYYISIAKLNKHIGVNSYFDPADGVIATDQEGLVPGIRLMVKEKAYKTKKWFSFSPIDGGVASYYPDHVVTDILKEKQENDLKKGKLFGLFKRDDDQDILEQYKDFDEKYEFYMPENKKSKKWYHIFTGKTEDDFSSFYASKKEYDDAFTTEVKEVIPDDVSTEEALSKFEAGVNEDDDLFEEFLSDREHKVFAEFHVQDSKYETVLAVRANSKVEYTVSELNDPYRIMITFTDNVVSSLPDFEEVGLGCIETIKAYHTEMQLPEKFEGWKKILSLIVECKDKSEFEISSTEDLFKVTLKK